MSKIRIDADTSPIKKSLLELSSEVKKLGGTGTKVSIFSEKDRRFLKSELGKELSSMKIKLKENRVEISKMISEQKKLTKGSDEELKVRNQILNAYKTQAKLGKEMEQVQSQQKQIGGVGGMGGKSGGMLSFLPSLATMAAGAVLGVAGMGVMKGIQASSQFVGGSSNRVKLRGLGVVGDSFGDPRALAEAGLTEQDAISRQIQATSRLGRQGGSAQSILQQAQFERAFGLESGAMTNVSTSLRAQFGGQGANEVQMKLQASILASGIEDAIGPYLESATALLSSINENGITQTDEMINILSTMTKNGERTPEQIAKAFQTIDSSVKGATGEQSAFLQTAFARRGIGGGTIGATRLAMQSGGIFGLNRDELEKRGYNKELLDSMGESGFFSGAGNRSSAILDQFKRSGGIGTGNIGDVKDLNTMVGLSQMSNSIFGTQGLQGFDALTMLEKVQRGEMSQKQFSEKLTELKEDRNPTVERLKEINKTLAGQTTIMTDINTNLMENLGKETVKLRNTGVEAQNAIIRGTTNVAGAATGALPSDAGRGIIGTLSDYTVGGKLGEWAYDTFFSKDGNMPSKNKSKMDDRGTAIKEQNEAMARAVESGMTKAMAAQKARNQTNVNQIKIINADGKVQNSTHKTK